MQKSFFTFQIQLLSLFAFGNALALAYPRYPGQCNIMESFPYFQSREEVANVKVAYLETIKDELMFQIEFSRFLNRKVPMLLEEFAESKKIFESKKRLGMLELEADLRREAVMYQKRNIRSVESPEGEEDIVVESDHVRQVDHEEPSVLFDAPKDRKKRQAEEETEEEPVVEETEDDEAHDPAQIGQDAGELAQEIIETLSGSAQDVIQLFQEIVQSVGGVLEDVST